MLETEVKFSNYKHKILHRTQFVFEDSKNIKSKTKINISFLHKFLYHNENSCFYSQQFKYCRPLYGNNRCLNPKKTPFTDNILLKISSNLRITSLANEINKLFHDLWVWRWLFCSLCLAYANVISPVRYLVILKLVSLRYFQSYNIEYYRYQVLNYS